MVDSSESKHLQEVMQKLQSQLGQLAEQKQQLHQEITHLESKLHDLEIIAAQKNNATADNAKKISKLKRQLEKVEQTAEKKIEEQKHIEQQIETLKDTESASDEYQALVDKNDSLKTQIQEGNQHVVEIDQQIQRLKDETEDQQKTLSEQQSIKKEAQLLREKYASAESIQHEINAINDNLDELKRNQFQLATKKNELITDHSRVKTLVESKKEQLELSKAELEKLQNELNTMTSERINLQNKIKSHQQYSEHDSSVHGKLKDEYDDVLAEIRLAEKEASQRNIDLENFHSQYEAQHDKVIREFEDRRDDIIRKQKKLRKQLRRATADYHKHLETMTKDLDHRNTEKQQRSDTASKQLQDMQDEFSENEKLLQQRLVQGESEAIINAEREREQKALNDFTKNELDRLNQQEKFEREARELQTAEEDTYLQQQTQLEQDLQAADEELIGLKNKEQQALHSITAQQQKEDTVLAQKRSLAHANLTELRTKLKATSKQLSDYEASHSQSTQLKITSELASLQKELERLEINEASANKKVSELAFNIDDTEKLMKSSVEQVENYPGELQRITEKLENIETKKINASESQKKLNDKLKALNLQGDEEQKLQEVESRLNPLIENESAGKNEHSVKISTLEGTKQQYLKQLTTLKQQVEEIEKKLSSTPKKRIDQKALKILEDQKQSLIDEIEKEKSFAGKLQQGIVALEDTLENKDSPDAGSEKTKLAEIAKLLHSKKLSLDNVNIESSTINDKVKQIQSRLGDEKHTSQIAEEVPRTVDFEDAKQQVQSNSDELTPEQQAHRKKIVEQAIREMKAKHKNLMSKDQVVRAEADEKIYQQIVSKVRGKLPADQSSQQNYRSEEALYEDFLRILAERKKTRGKTSSPELDRMHRKLAEDSQKKSPTESLQQEALETQASSLRRELLEQAAVESESNQDIIAYKALMEEINSNKSSTRVQQKSSSKTNVPPKNQQPFAKTSKSAEKFTSKEVENVKNIQEFKQQKLADESPSNVKIHAENKEPSTKSDKIQQAQHAVSSMQQKIASADSGMHLQQDTHHEESESINKQADIDDIDFISSSRDAVLSERSRWGPVLMYSIIFFIAIAIVWAKLTVLDEITAAQGKVIPSSQIQVIQNLEGGILSELFVREGDTVKKGQVLLRIDDTRFSSSFKEGEQKYISLLAAISRLRAEATGAEKITFPNIVKTRAPDVIKNEQQLFDSQREQIESNTETLQKSYNLAVEELEITKPLVQEGLMSQLELLRLKRQVNELQGDIDKAKDEFRSNAQKELNEKEAEYSALKESLKAAEDRLTRTTVRSPVTGTVNVVHISTVGAVIQPGVSILEIVPTEDNLLVEAKVKPQDIAFIRPGQHAIVKITAYDYTIYGGLDGTVEHISADTIEEEKNTKKDESYYKILVRTKKNYLGKESKPLYIIPGMTVSIDVMTGKKSVLDYLLKPILKARQSALRER